MNTYCNSKGALPRGHILSLMEEGVIIGANEQNLSPASLDLSLSSDIYSIGKTFLPTNGYTVEEILNNPVYEAYKHNLDQALQPGVDYIVKLNEQLMLSSVNDLYAYANPKSTAGRDDLHVRLVVSGGYAYDQVTAEYDGNLWCFIKPNSFCIKLSPGDCLNQLRFFNAYTKIKDQQLQEFQTKFGLVRYGDGKIINYADFKYQISDGNIVLSLGLDFDKPGFVARKTRVPIEYSRVNHYSHETHFEEVEVVDGGVFLKKDHFYILSTLENVSVPDFLACEMVPMDSRFGEFRAHYAGFIDSGWGGEKGRPLTLEVRPFEDTFIRHGQPIAAIKFEMMTEQTDVPYDAAHSNYSNQSGPVLSKHFRPLD